MNFDLHFTSSVIEPLTQKGVDFLAKIGSSFTNDTISNPVNYRAAKEAGLSISFENVWVRNWVTGAEFEALRRRF